MKAIRILASMIRYGFHRSKGIFSFLFWADDFLRLFTMTLFFPIVLNWLNMPDLVIILSLVLGLIIDAHDYMEEVRFTRRY